MYRALIRPWLFRHDPEDAHHFVMGLLRRWPIGCGLARRLLAVDDPRLRVEALGLSFGNPIGLGAGLDKDGEAAGAWGALGFGFVEIGTVTPRPQEGNPRPRLFRLASERALINRMGFNSAGAETVRANLARGGATGIPIGINVGKNRDTPNERAADDYRAAMAPLVPFADYFVINVSSPNTKGLRALQEAGAVGDLVAAAVEVARGDGRARPVLVKLAPDFEGDALEETVRAARAAGAAGFVATNTTVGRTGVEGSPFAAEAGGLSGAPLRARATEVLRRVYRATDGALPIIGVGGVATAADAYEKIRAGASLVQVYTGLIYEGPCIARAINRGLLALLARDGLPSVAAAVGLDAK